MRAAVYTRFGPPDVISIEEIEAPQPGAEEILVRVHATTVTRTDCYARSGEQLLWHFIQGFRKPRRRVLGFEFAGVVESLGSKATGFAVGDEVFGRTWFGAHAELVAVNAGRLVAHKPQNVSFEQAAPATDGALSALACLSRAGVGPKKDVLIYGASGSIGTAAVQLAKSMGAHVTAVTRTKNVDLIRSLGADQVLDYEQGDDFTKNRNGYDVVVDAVGKITFMRSRRALRPGGFYASTDGFRNFFLGPVSRLTSRRVALPITRPTRADIDYLAGLMERGEYRPVIDQTYPLEQIVAAHRHVETKQKTGNVVIAVNA